MTSPGHRGTTGTWAGRGGETVFCEARVLDQLRAINGDNDNESGCSVLLTSTAPTCLITLWIVDIRTSGIQEHREEPSRNVEYPADIAVCGYHGRSSFYIISISI